VWRRVPADSAPDGRRGVGRRGLSGNRSRSAGRNGGWAVARHSVRRTVSAEGQGRRAVLGGRVFPGVVRAGGTAAAGDGDGGLPSCGAWPFLTDLMRFGSVRATTVQSRGPLVPVS
jgi:hypothetical protein